MNKLYYYIFIIVFLLSACGQKENSDNGGTVGNTENFTVKFTPDRTSMIRNPLNGWVMYMGRGWDENLWSTTGYDNIYIPSLGKEVRVSDYATCAYIRTSWASLEPSEGNYVWTDPTARLTRLIEAVRKRGLKIAFRIVVDGRDQGQNTPQYVFDAGAEYFDDPNYLGRGRISPYPDDPVFQEKYTKFIKALAKYFDDPDKTEFIDGYGLGKWGEGHTLIYKDSKNKRAVYDWITSLYSESFKRVPIVMNYHRLIGESNTSGWGAVASDTDELLMMAVNKGYSLRHDAFGMNGYYQNWEKQFAMKMNFNRPIIMEGGWIVDSHRYWLDPAGYREGHPEDVRLGEFKASEEAKVNMMDFRAGNETKSWFNDAFELVERFVQEGGYRLYPDNISLPLTIENGKPISITHRWLNLGWGYCPTNIPQWNQKYKVAFAILDSKNEVVKVFVDENTDLSKWLKGSPATYTTKITPQGLSSGKYKWAVGIVDTTKNNTIGIRLALRSPLPNGWNFIKDLNVK